MVRELFRDQAATEFIIATIPTVLGINESARLLQALRKERIPCKRIIVNQVRRRAAHRRRPLCADSCPGARVSASADCCSIFMATDWYTMWQPVARRLTTTT